MRARSMAARWRRRATLLWAPALTLAAVVYGTAVPAGAQSPVADFYKGRNVQAIVGYAPGSTFELYIRVLSRHIGRHIPGNPTVIVQHMPGAGSLTATNYLAAVAPKDGSVFGMPNPVNTIEPLLDPQRTKFDPRTFNWLGSLNSEISTCGFWAKDLRTLEDMKKREITVGSTGPASGSTIDARVLGELLKLRIKVVTGYRTLTDIKLAAERGEVDGFCGLVISALKTDFADDHKSGKLAVPIQMGLARHPEYQDIPNAFDMVTSEEDKAFFRLIFGPWSYGRPLFAPPGTPADRVAALRAALQATLADPEFQAEAKKVNMELRPLPADAIPPLVEAVLKTPEPVLVRARALLGVANR